MLNPVGPPCIFAIIWDWDEIDLIPAACRDVVSYSRGTSGEDNNSISAAADAMRNGRYETAM